MDVFMNVINFIMEAGSYVFMPIIIFILGIVFGLKPGKAFKAGVTTGIGFIGINLVLGLLGDNLMGVVDNLVSIYNFKLTAVDVGWTIGGAVAWSSNAILVPTVIIAILAMNIVLIAVGFTKTLDVDIWNYWQPLFLAGVTYVATKNMLLSVIAPCIVMAIMFKIADYCQPHVEEFFGMPGISIPQIESTSWAIIGIPLNKLIDKIPVINKIDWTPENISKKLGIMGDPVIIGIIIGGLLAAFAQLDAKTVLNVAIATGAAMYLLPKMIGVLMEGLLPISESASAFMQKRFKGRELFIGLDAAIVVGHPAIIATSLLLIPTTLFLAVILPGNITLPLAELSGICFFVVWAVVPSRGNVFRGWLIGTFIMAIVLLIASDYAKPMTDLIASVPSYEMPENVGGRLVTCLSIGGEWISWVVYKIIMFFTSGSL